MISKAKCQQVGGISALARFSVILSFFLLFFNLTIAPVARSQPTTELHVNAVVNVDTLNVRTKAPTFEKKEFFVWEWEFGKVKTQLSRGTEVEIREEVTVATVHIWAHIRYRVQDGIEEGWVYFGREGETAYLRKLGMHPREIPSLQQNPKPTSFTMGNWFFGLSSVHAQGVMPNGSPEEQTKEYQNPRVDIRIPSLVMIFLFLLIFYIAFKHLGIKSDSIKLLTATLLSTFVSLSVGLAAFPQVLEIIKILFS